MGLQKLAVIRETFVAGAAKHIHLSVHSMLTYFELQALSSFRRNQRVSLLNHEEQKSSNSVSHYLQPARQTNCSQRRIPLIALKSIPDYCRLLACQQQSFRPSGHPLAVQL